MAQNNGQAGETQQLKEKEVCGIIMPIADTGSYPIGHWQDVRSVLYEVIELAGYFPNLVSNANDTGVIHNRIIGNLFNNPIVVCDVSSRNPNVMFELGMRLAFDKAVVVITDDKTKFSFDTQVVEHLIYPSDLNYRKIIEFKSQLKEKIISTYEAFKNPDNPTFLKSFIQYKPIIKQEDIGLKELLIKELQQLNEKVETIKAKNQIVHISNTEPNSYQQTNPSIISGIPDHLLIRIVKIGVVAVPKTIKFLAKTYNLYPKPE